MKLENLKKWSKQHHAELREKINSYASTYQLNAVKTLELLAAQRWLERLISHSLRLVNVLKECQQSLRVAEVDDEHV